MNEIQIFNNKEFGNIRTVNIDGEPWFVGKDVANALGYSNNRKAISDHVGEEDKRDLEQGLFEVKESNVQNPDGSIRITRTTKITGRGQLYFVNKFLGRKEE